MQDSKPDYSLVFLAVTGFLCFQLWQTTAVLDTTKSDLKIYQSREARTDALIQQLRGFNK